jgi:mRNA interferase RelE/StbE
LKPVWRVEFAKSAKREFAKLGSQDRKRILDFIDERLVPGNPRQYGHALTGPLAGLWSFRVGDVRLLARIEDRIVTVFVMHVGNRREIYR